MEAVAFRWRERGSVAVQIFDQGPKPKLGKSSSMGGTLVGEADNRRVRSAVCIRRLRARAVQCGHDEIWQPKSTICRASSSRRMVSKMASNRLADYPASLRITNLILRYPLWEIPDQGQTRFSADEVRRFSRPAQTRDAGFTQSPIPHDWESWNYQYKLRDGWGCAGSSGNSSRIQGIHNRRSSRRRKCNWTYSKQDPRSAMDCKE